MMKDVTTAIVRVIAWESGARLVVKPGIAYDTTDSALAVMANALQERVESAGIDLVALRRNGTTLTAEIDDTMADLPLSAAEFHQVVRSLSYKLLGEVWDGEAIFVEPAETPNELVRVA